MGQTATGRRLRRGIYPARTISLNAYKLTRTYISLDNNITASPFGPYPLACLRFNEIFVEIDLQGGTTVPAGKKKRPSFRNGLFENPVSSYFLRKMRLKDLPSCITWI